MAMQYQSVQQSPVYVVLTGLVHTNYMIHRHHIRINTFHTCRSLRFERIVHGDIRHLEIGLHDGFSIRMVHGDIRHLEKGLE